MIARVLALLEVPAWYVGFRPIEYLVVLGLYAWFRGDPWAWIAWMVVLTVVCLVAGVAGWEWISRH